MIIWLRLVILIDEVISVLGAFSVGVVLAEEPWVVSQVESLVGVVDILGVVQDALHNFFFYRVFCQNLLKFFL